MGSPLTETALRFAISAHHGQVRKYTGMPYIFHPVGVASLVSEYGGTEDMVIAALLHDVLEDTSTTAEQIEDLFGPTVTGFVEDLTEHPHAGNRAMRKNQEAFRLVLCSEPVHTIKIADLIDNARSILRFDPKFGKVFLEEMRTLTRVLHRANPDLLRMAMSMLPPESPA